MALTRQASTTSLLRGTRFESENADRLGGRVPLGKGRPATAAARSALGNISNRSSGTQSIVDQKKDSAFPKPSKPVLRSAHSVVLNKENAVKVQREQKEQTQEVEKPASPMDISLGHSTALPPNVTDIDKDDHSNPQLVSSYVNEIYDYLRQLEEQYPIKQRYLDGSGINGKMRGILVDWLVQVHLRFHLLQETLYLTVAIIDRFLQEQSVSRSKLQLVGVTAMLIASKYEEMYAPEINDFVYITDSAYTKKEICEMERLMLKTLGFNLGRPISLHFLRRNSKAGEVDANKHTLAKYLSELTITEYDMVHTKPSEIAAAALCLSMKLFDNSNWNDTVSHYSKYSENELHPIMCKLASLVTKAGTGKLTTIKAKYSSAKFMRIALIPELKSPILAEMAKSLPKQ